MNGGGGTAQRWGRGARVAEADGGGERYRWERGRFLLGLRWRAPPSFASAGARLPSVQARAGTGAIKDILRQGGGGGERERGESE